MKVLRFLKDEWELTADDARSKDNYALRWAAKNGHVEILRFLKDVFGLTADDTRDRDNHALILAAENGHVDVLKVLVDEFQINLTRLVIRRLKRESREYNQQAVLDYLDTTDFAINPKSCCILS